MTDPIADFDFTSLPCAGIQCFRLPVASRHSCTQEPHQCTGHDYECRCCPSCRQACANLDEALEKVNGS